MADPLAGLLADPRALDVREAEVQADQTRASTVSRSTPELFQLPEGAVMMEG